MAILKTAAHVDDDGLPLNKYVIEIEVATTTWDARIALTAAGLDVGWDGIPHGVISIETGSAWYMSNDSALLELPSAIAPEDP